MKSKILEIGIEIFKCLNRIANINIKKKTFSQISSMNMR